MNTEITEQESSEQETKEVEPTGGWLQYRLAISVLMLYPLLMLGGGFILLSAWPHFHGARSRTEIVSPTSHEPYHLTLSAPSGRIVGHPPLAYRPAQQQP